MSMTEEDINIIIDGIVSRLKPVLDRLVESDGSGVVIGARNICKYMGLRSGVSGKQFDSSMIRKWRIYKGFPAGKTATGKWWVSKTAIDNWLYERNEISRKAMEMKVEARSAVGAGGKFGFFEPERYTSEQRAEVVRELIKERIKGNEK